MENNFYRTINIEEDWAPRFNVNWDSIQDPDPKKPPFEKHFTNINEVIPEYIVTRLKDVGLTLRTARIFSWPRSKVGVWHVDGRRFTEQTAMNFVLSGTGSKMQWTDAKLPTKRYFENWEGGRPSPDDNIIAETSGNKIFVNIGINHRVVTESEGRITLSLLWKESCNYPFDQMVVRLADAGFLANG